jgi:hypothetical protein
MRRPLIVESSSAIFKRFAVSFPTMFPTPYGLLRAFLLLTMTGCISPALWAQVYGTASHKVTVKVQAVTLLQISSSTVNLSITGSNAIAGQNQMTVSDQSSTILWGVNSSPKKITAGSNLAAPKYTLQLVALSPTTGTAGSQTALSTTAFDFLTNIGHSSGSAKLSYTAIALASQGTGSDAHTITFTVTIQ